VFGLKALLEEWLTFRRETVTRRLKYRLERVTRRLHILEGLLAAYLNIDAVIKIIREDDEPKAALMRRFKLSDTQAEAILELRLRHLARLEEFKIRGEQESLASEQADLERTLKSKTRLTTLIKTELLELAEAFGDARRTIIVERAPAQAISESELVTSEPVTVVLSERGWARAAKGHEVDAESLSYRAGDGFLAAARGRSNQLAVFVDNRGRAYSVPAHALPSARGQGEPLSGFVKSPDGVSFRALVIGDPEDRCLLASSAGYGFLAKLGELHTRNRAGKAVMSVPGDATLVPAAPIAPDSRWIAAVSSDGRLLVCKLDDLPELARGKGVRVLGVPRQGDVSLVGVCALAEGQGLVLRSNQRSMTISAADLKHYRSPRGRRGTALSRGWRKIDRLLPA
jgi:topoisomerase-4 subunit A